MLILDGVEEGSDTLVGAGCGISCVLEKASDAVCDFEAAKGGTAAPAAGEGSGAGHAAGTATGDAVGGGGAAALRADAATAGGGLDGEAL